MFTPDAAGISSVVLIRPGAPTHAFDMEQRLIELNYTAGTSALDVTAPPNGNIAPPGYYMLFVLNGAGVPSVATFIHLGTAAPNQAPSATITAPTSDVTIAAGGSVAFSGMGNDPDGSITGYSWSFPGGTPASSTVQNTGNVTYSTPGTFVASLTVTDNGGLTSPAATRTITVPDFSIRRVAVIPHRDGRHGDELPYDHHRWDRIRRNRQSHRERTPRGHHGLVHGALRRRLRVVHLERHHIDVDAWRHVPGNGHRYVGNGLYTA